MAGDASILVFGGSGQVGQEIQKRVSVICPSAQECDIRNASAVEECVSRKNPKTIIHLAAYTAVDRAEEEKDFAFEVNATGSKNIALAAKTIGSRLIYVSTDYVFGNGHSSPISEDTPPGPLNVYGKSKLLGEQAVQEVLGDKVLIVRTSSVHGVYGSNFVHTMIRLLKERDEVRVVHDQQMSPTWAGWLGEILIELSKLSVSGTLHASCAGSLTWYEFAQAIAQEMSRTAIGEPKAQILPISAEDFSLPARRSQYSVLDCSKLSKAIGKNPMQWEEGLHRHFNDLKEREQE